MRAKVTLIESSHSRLRKKEYIGQAVDIPRVDSSIVLIDDDKDYLLTTTPIKEVRKLSEKEVAVKTRNSLYSFELLEGSFKDNETF